MGKVALFQTEGPGSISGLVSMVNVFDTLSAHCAGWRRVRHIYVQYVRYCICNSSLGGGAVVSCLSSIRGSQSVSW